MRTVRYRGRPAFAGAAMRVEAWHDEAGGLRLRTVDSSGAACMTADAA